MFPRLPLNPLHTPLRLDMCVFLKFLTQTDTQKHHPDGTAVLSGRLFHPLCPTACSSRFSIITYQHVLVLNYECRGDNNSLFSALCCYLPIVLLILCVPQVKTEEQIAAEQAWYGSEKVWLVHKDGFSLGEADYF